MGYQTFLKMKSSKLKFATVNVWLIYLDLMKVQHLARTAVQENDFNMRILAWEKILPFYFYFSKMNYVRYGTYYLQHLTH